jgi:hypothetical protein
MSKKPVMAQLPLPVSAIMPEPIDVETVSAVAFAEWLNKMRAWSDEAPPSTEEIPATGWAVITPLIALAIWRGYKANRKISLSTVRKYVFAMLAGEWRKTGQPILIDEDGEPTDGYHRLIACILSGKPFPTFIVSDVPVDPYAFTFIDIGKGRSPADALTIAGQDGVASVIAGAVKLAWRYDNDALRIIKPPRIRDMTQYEIVVYVEANKSLVDSAHLVAGSYGAAMKTIGNKAVGTFFTWKARELFSDQAVEDFLIPLGLGANLAPDSPILACRDRLRAVAASRQEELSEQHRLALLIKAFVMHTNGVKVGKKGLSLRDNEKFPRLEDAEVMDTAAE